MNDIKVIKSSDSTSDKPLVSVLMTAFNRSMYIRDAIESVLNSSYENFELVIVDDNSSDDTVLIAQRFENLDSRVRVYQNEKNLGDYKNRNKAASYAKGKYIKYLDSDDIIYSHGLTVMVDCMENNPSAGFGLSEYALDDRPHPILVDSHQAYYYHYFKGELFGRSPGSGIIKKDLFDRVGGFSGAQYIGDHEFWLNLARQVSMVMMPRDLVWDRTHEYQEKSFDKNNPAEISSLHYQLDLNALIHSNCPLSIVEIEQAMHNMKVGRIRLICSMLLKTESWKSAFHIRRKTGIKWIEIFYFLFNRTRK